MKRKILVVDDDRSILIALETLLDMEGFQVMTATDGKAGFEAFESFGPDLVLVDVMMPQVGGHELVHRIRSSEDGAKVKIIYLSAKGMESDKRTGYAKGADDYIVKPYSIPDLLETIRLNLS